MIAKKEDFIDAGMFDDDFFLYLEDMDLCWRMRLAGKSVKYVPSAVVFHAAAGSRNRTMLARAWFHVVKNQIAMITKNYSWRYLPKSLLGRLLCYAIVAIYYPFSKLLHPRRETGFLTEPAPVLQMIFAVLSGVFWNIRSLRATLAKRSWIQTRLRRVPDRRVIAFMERRNAFAELLRHVASS